MPGVLVDGERDPMTAKAAPGQVVAARHLGAGEGSQPLVQAGVLGARLPAGGHHLVIDARQRVVGEKAVGHDRSEIMWPPSRVGGTRRPPAGD